mgnify:CR=1 FL=1
MIMSEIKKVTKKDYASKIHAIKAKIKKRHPMIIKARFVILLRELVDLVMRERVSICANLFRAALRFRAAIVNPIIRIGIKNRRDKYSRLPYRIFF